MSEGITVRSRNLRFLTVCFKSAKTEMVSASTDHDTKLPLGTIVGVAIGVPTALVFLARVAGISVFLVYKLQASRI